MAYTTKQLQAVLAKVHKPHLAKLPGMVRQVWEDGEITLQKSGDLLWQRNLHMITPGLRTRKVPVECMPDHDDPKKPNAHGFAYVETEEDAMIVRDMINNLEGGTPDDDIYYEAYSTIKAGRT